MGLIIEKNKKLLSRILKVNVVGKTSDYILPCAEIGNKFVEDGQTHTSLKIIYNSESGEISSLPYSADDKEYSLVALTFHEEQDKLTYSIDLRDPKADIRLKLYQRRMASMGFQYDTKEISESITSGPVEFYAQRIATITRSKAKDAKEWLDGRPSFEDTDLPVNLEAFGKRSGDHMLLESFLAFNEKISTLENFI